MAKDVAELFGEAEPAVEPTPATETKPEAPVQPAPQAAAPTVEPPKPAVVEPPKAEPGHIPIAALLDEREKRRKAEERATALEAKHRTPETAPSVQDDPEAFTQYVQQLNERATISSTFNISEIMATEKHGADAVKAAMEWGMERSQTSPAFAAEYLKQKHPIDWAVRQHKREKTVSEMGDDEATQKAYIERRARELGLIPAAPPTPGQQPAPAAPQPVVQKQATPSPSLASAPSAGGLQTPVMPKAHPDLVKLGLAD